MDIIDFIENEDVDVARFNNNCKDGIVLAMINSLNNFEYFKIRPDMNNYERIVYVSALDASYIGSNIFTKQEKEKFIQIMNNKYKDFIKWMVEGYKDILQYYPDEKNTLSIEQVNHMPDYSKLKTKENKI